jgi:hypothetical protein
MAEPRPLTAVVCATYREFIVWCIDNDRSPHDPSLKLVTDRDQIQGCYFDQVVGIGEREPGLIDAALSRLRPESDLRPTME